MDAKPNENATSADQVALATHFQSGIENRSFKA